LLRVGHHDFITEEVAKAVVSVQDIISVSDVQVYYKNDGRVGIKVDVYMNPELSIKLAHRRALQARKAVEVVLPNVEYVDVDLELDESDEDTSPQNEKPPV
jgi:divalent metal cation (Fe/Co/Zn/Cd) transporter